MLKPAPVKPPVVRIGMEYPHPVGQNRIRLTHIPLNVVMTHYPLFVVAASTLCRVIA